MILYNKEEIYLDKGYDNCLWIDKLKELIKSGKIFIALKGSALLDECIKEFLGKQLKELLDNG